MVGTYLHLPKSKQWYLRNINLVTPNNYVSIHLDEMVGQIQKNLTLTICFEILKVLAEESKDNRDPVKITLVLPLASTKNRIYFRYPQSTRSLLRALEKEPPSFYLQSWERSKRFSPFEEYRIPVNMEIPVFLVPNFIVFYRVYRYGIVMKNAWEFSRSIDLDYFPEGIAP